MAGTLERATATAVVFFRAIAFLMREKKYTFVRWLASFLPITHRVEMQRLLKTYCMTVLCALCATGTLDAMPELPPAPAANAQEQ